MTETLFISDLHLDRERPDIQGLFHRFLQDRAAQADALYILGDLFEFWIGDDDPSPLSREVVDSLRALTDQGTRLFFQQGNRDFLVGRRFARAQAGDGGGGQRLAEYGMVSAYGAQPGVMCGQDDVGGSIFALYGGNNTPGEDRGRHICK